MLFVLRKLSRILLLLCFSLAGEAESLPGTEPALYSPIVLNPSTSEVSISSVAEEMCDTAGNIPLDVAQAGSYIPLTEAFPTSNQCRSYWLRFNLLANRLPPGGWVLQLSRGWWRADLYYEQGGRTSVLRTGLALPPPERAISSGYLLLPLPLESDRETTFYLHLQGDTSRYGEARSVSGMIQRFDANQAQRRQVLFGQGIYSGIILALVLYNLILYFAIGEDAYLYYSLYVLTFGSVWTARTGFLFQYFWPHHPLFESESQFYLVALSIVFGSFFVRHFLATRDQSKWVDRTLLTIAFFTSAMCVFRIAGNRGASTVLLAVDGLLTTILFAVVGVIFLYRGYRPARFFLVAWTLQLVGNAMYIFAFLRLIPFNFFTYNAAQIGSGVESILLAFALADRVNLLKHEKQEKQLQYTHELQEQVKERTEELTNAVAKLKTASVTDPLTGLSNRRRVDEAIQPWIAELQRERLRNPPGTPRRYLALCLADLDNFKLINDGLGHAVGDKILQAAADTLRQNVRATAMLARWGGEEFLILDHVTGPQEDLLMAERLRRSIIEECPAIILEIGRPLSLSLGVVRYPFSETIPQLLDWDHCLAVADHALYRAKRAGRNCWRCYRPNESALRDYVQVQGIEAVRRVMRTRLEEAVAMGLIEVVEHNTSDMQVI
jgi:two-component system, sensor histidine kinase LadS